MQKRCHDDDDDDDDGDDDDDDDDDDDICNCKRRLHAAKARFFRKTALAFASSNALRAIYNGLSSLRWRWWSNLAARLPTEVEYDHCATLPARAEVLHIYASAMLCEELLRGL